MKDASTIAMRVAPWVIPALTMGVFTLDLLTPLGVAVPVLYAIPLLLTLLPSRRPREPLYFSAVATVLILVAVLLKPAGVPITYVLFNRALGTMIIWGIAIGLIQYKRTQVELKAERIERAHAEGLMMEAQEARAYVDTSLVGATASRRAVEEKLLISQLRLEGIIQSAMDAIITVDQDQNIVMFNRAAEHMFSCSTQDAIGQSLDRFIPSRFRTAHREHIKTFGRSGSTNRRMGALGQVSGLRADGTEFPVEASISQVGVEGHRYFTVILRDITERKRTEEQRQQFVSLVENSHEFIGMCDMQFKPFFVNEAGMRMVGMDGLEQAVQTPVREFFFPEDRTFIMDKFFPQVLRDGHGEVEIRFRHFKTGEPLWMIYAVFVLKQTTGKSSGFATVSRNISERKRAEEALRESERVHRTLLSNLSGMAYRCRNDKDWTMEIVSEGCEALTGYPPEDLMGNRRLSFNSLIHPDDRQRVWDQFQKSLETRGPCSSEYRIRTAGGQEKWVWDQAQGIFGTGGELQAIEGYIADITERKQAANRLHLVQERYRRLVEVSPEAIFVNRDDRIIFMNDQGLRLFGAVRADEVLGKSLLELFHRNSHARISDSIHRLVEGGTTVPIAGEQIVRLDGEVVDVEVSIARFVDEEGMAILLVVRDISERKRIQEQLRKAERLAELGTLASGMAHEIGTPMNVILGRAEYLMERVKEAPIKKGLETIVSQVERITKVMNQLLAFTRRRPTERRMVDLRQAIEDNLDIFRDRFAKQSIKLETELAISCSPVRADGDQMSQVIINLVMNAIQAMPGGGTLRVGLMPNKDMVVLTVTDTGHGIPQEVIAKVFDPFFTTKEFGKGTGLGLTVVKGIIEEHQGSITVESEPGKGTTFTISLPLA